MTGEEIAIVDGLKDNGIASLKDKDGNARFVEGTGATIAHNGVTYTFNKYSLSGTHLMLVLGLNIDSEVTIAGGTKLVTFTIPQWLYDKISTLWGARGVMIKNETAVATDGGNFSTFTCYLLKELNARQLSIATLSNYTALTGGSSVRIQFDLLIDADYDE